MWGQIREGTTVYLAWAYEDPMAGPSARGVEFRAETWQDDVRSLLRGPNMTFRLTGGRFEFMPLPPEAVARLGLPERPDWVEFSPPPPRHPWHDDSALAGRFHEDFRDDLEVDFLFPAGAMERMWVRVTAVERAVGGYAGELLNTPYAPEAGLAAGAQVRFRVSGPHGSPVWVSPTVLENHRDWIVECSCGFDMLPWPVTSLLAEQFPGRDPRNFHSFTTRCPECRATMMVTRRRAE